MPRRSHMSELEYRNLEAETEQEQEQEHNTDNNAVESTPPLRGSTFGTRNSNNRSSLRNSRVSDTGIEFKHAEPSATIFSTVMTTCACILGSGILTIADGALHLGLGNAIIVLTFFWLLSMFSCYVLSICSEYLGIFSQAQMLTACLCGGPQTVEDISIVKTAKLEKENRGEKQQQTNNTKQVEEETTLNKSRVDESSPLVQKQQNEQNTNNKNNEEEQNKEEEEKEEDNENYVKAVLDAQVSRNRINLFIDILNGITYLLYIVAFSRAFADAGVSISHYLGFPDFFKKKIGWLSIASVLYIVLSLRRVFAELTIACIFGICTIMFVVLCVVIRYFHPFEIHYEPISNYPPAGSSGSDYFYLGSSFLQAFSVVSSAFAYQVNHPPFYLELKQRSPANMQKTVLLSNTIVYVTYIVIACFGLALFGSYVDEKSAGGNIVNVFSSKDVLITVARFTLMFHFIMVTPIIICTTRQNFHRVILRIFGLDDRADNVDEVFTVPFFNVVIEAVASIIIALVIAQVVPGIGVVAGLCGALGGGVAIMVLPGICGMKVFGEFLERGFTGGNEEECYDGEIVKNNNEEQKTKPMTVVVSTHYSPVDTSTSSSSKNAQGVGGVPELVVRNQTPHESNNNNNNGIPAIITSIHSNNMLGYFRFRLSNRVIYYMCAFLVIFGTITSIASLILILLSLK